MANEVFAGAKTRPLFWGGCGTTGVVPCYKALFFARWEARLFFGGMVAACVKAAVPFVVTGGENKRGLL
jgi:hypothetical protein